jgi:hypothetical protein
MNRSTVYHPKFEPEQFMGRQSCYTPPRRSLRRDHRF